jgi:aspartyl-tRNA(Asn)/glutamyl-tRNA(Gln) amidotransferase subunit C
MSKLSRDDVLKLARLSRLRLTDDEIERFSEELSAILDYVETLNSVDVTGLQPTYQLTGLKNVVRVDKEKDYGYKPADLLKNAPAVEKNQFKVKRVIE